MTQVPDRSARRVHESAELARMSTGGSPPDQTSACLASWVVSGTHRLVEWETKLSSRTGASQAGIVLGDNDDIRVDLPHEVFVQPDEQRDWPRSCTCVRCVRGRRLRVHLPMARRAFPDETPVLSGVRVRLPVGSRSYPILVSGALNRLHAPRNIRQVSLRVMADGSPRCPWRSGSR